ncbi:MAG: amino acid ABC transporter ATP-binding protein [Clostridia bacterium]|nr:amino acid ABC transporter ATP-binding protein [Clostridia bacterium]
MAFLEIKNLKKSFGSTAVLHGIDFSMEEGEVVAVLGSSGGGKTTFLRCLNFLEMANEGTIEIEGGFSFDAARTYTPAEIRAMRLKLGLVFQSFNLFPQYSALENVYLPLQLRTKERIRETVPFGRKRREAVSEALAENKARAEALLRGVGLGDKMGNYPWQLSGGQQQRVAIARALAQEPAILCFDEPTSALDPELTGEVLRVIRELKDQGRTMLVVTHEMDFAKNVADRIIFFADGLIEEDASPEEFFSNPKSPKAQAFLSHARSSDGTES